MSSWANEQNWAFSSQASVIKTKEALSDVISVFTLNYTINKTKAVLYAHLCVYSHSGCAIVTRLRFCCQISISYANLTTNISIETKLRIICVICVFILKYTTKKTKNAFYAK